MSGKLSVIIPVFNTRNYLKKALDSIRSQTYRDLDIILIDDGSEDGSLDLCLEIAAADRRITVHSQENSGVAAARNAGLTRATGDYITFFDSDDWLDNTAYERMIELLESSAADIAICGYLIEFPDHRYIAPRYHVQGTIIKNSTEFLKDMLTDNIAGFCPNKIIKRETIRKNDTRFDQRLSVLEDFLFLTELCREDPVIVCSEEPFFHYRRREDSLSNSAVNDKKLTICHGTELILGRVLEYFPQLRNQAAEFYYHTNIGLLNEIYHSRPINPYYRDKVKSSIKRAGLLRYTNWKVRIKALLILYFPKLFGYYHGG